MKTLQMVLVLGASALLSACPTTSVRPPQTSAALPAIGAPDLRGATTYTVAADASEVSIHVFRGGTLARLGHNHVVTSTDVTGRVWLHDNIVKSGFELEFPVDTLMVDEPRARVAAGGEFPGEISAEDRDGTRKNMLRAEVLDAANHPTIRLQSTAITGSTRAPQIKTRITLKGVAREVLVPVTLSVEGDRLIGSGEFDIQQTAFGIKPFSIGLGALEVQDRLHIEFRIEARR